MRILIIDDEEFKINAYKKSLKRRRSKIDVAKTGDEGFKLLKENNYDWLILDMKFPMNSDSFSDSRAGLKILEKIKNANIDIKVIICSFGYSYASEIKDTYKDIIKSMISFDSENLYGILLSTIYLLPLYKNLPY